MARQLNAPNLHHFWDSEERIATSYAKQFHWNEFQAWDVYLFFKPGTTWSEVSNPPSAHVWYHQRSGVNNHRDKMVADWKMHRKLQKIIDEFILASSE